MLKFGTCTTSAPFYYNIPRGACSGDRNAFPVSFKSESNSNINMFTLHRSTLCYLSLAVNAKRLSRIAYDQRSRAYKERSGSLIRDQGRGWGWSTKTSRFTDLVRHRTDVKMDVLAIFLMGGLLYCWRSSNEASSKSGGRYRICMRQGDKR